jgi:hypothetical protein
LSRPVEPYVTIPPDPAPRPEDPITVPSGTQVAAVQGTPTVDSAAGRGTHVRGHGILERLQLAGLGVAADDNRVEDAQRAPVLDPLQRADQLAPELGIRPKSVEQQLRGGQRKDGAVDRIGHDKTSLLRVREPIFVRGPYRRIVSIG